MKKIFLILFIPIFFTSFSYAGGDDRDLQLPKKYFNEELDKTPSFLQEDSSELIQLDANEADEQAQPKLVNQESNKISLETSAAINSISSSILVDDGQGIMDFGVTAKFLKTEQGIIIMLVLIVIGLILLFNFFFREKDS